MRYEPEHWTTERWEKGHRYYLVEVRQDLFGGWELMRTWGRKCSRRGRMTTMPMVDRAAALAQLVQVAGRRTQRGYAKVSQ